MKHKITLFFLYINTVKYLKISQIFYRVCNLSLPRLWPLETPAVQIRTAPFIQSITKPDSFDGNDTFRFLNLEGKLSKLSWFGKDRPVLWRYNQHYFDWINSVNARKNPDIFSRAISDWMYKCAETSSLAWDPYPTSLRVVNWIKALQEDQLFPDGYLDNLYLQCEILNRRIEWHLQGNHLFTNAKALVVAGLYFKTKRSEKWFKNGSNILLNELQEQILDDGGHFELSPMYHAIILEDCLDLYNFLNAYPASGPKVDQLISLLDAKIKKMLFWISKMSFNNRYSHFNDSTGGIAVDLSDLIDYASRLGINFKKDKNTFEKPQITVLRNSGFSVVENSSMKFIYDHGEIGAKYQPGHGHADTLSFECEINKKSFIVNSGISEYENSDLRLFQRSTSAHSTLNINDISSSEIWSSFRVANRAKIVNFEVDHINLHLVSSHNGYSSKFKGLLHKRKCTFFKDKFQIDDELSRFVNDAKVYYYIHPKWQIECVVDGFICRYNSTQILISSSSKKIKLSKSKYYPQFYTEVPNYRIEYSLSNLKLSTQFEILNL
jgi:uncharacterized heparinase superfamily protein